MSIEVKSQKKGQETNEGRAKHSVISINNVKADFPRRVSHISQSDSSDVALFRSEFDVPVVSEFAVKLTPKKLRELVADDSKHQSEKDRIRKLLADAGSKSINIAYPILVNAPEPKETNFKPFGKPTERMMEKIFDLFDIENFGIMILPVTGTNGDTNDWVKLSTDVFHKRKPDFIQEHHFSGYIPRNVSEKTAITLAKYYLDNDIDSLTIDFDSRKVPESRLKNIILGVGEKRWGNTHIHGTNVPYYDWHGTWRRDVTSAYDLLVSVYGFDSFGNTRLGGGEPVETVKIKDTMNRKRYLVIDTYGMYGADGLKRLTDTHTLKCTCPICRKIKPIGIYDKPATQDALENLKTELKTHRIFNTHNETNGMAKLIDDGKLLDHMKTKKDSANELASILKEFETKS